MKKNIILFSLIICSFNSFAQQNTISKDVKEYVKSLVENNINVGISVAYINGNTIDYYNYGKTALEDGTDVNESSIYEIGSISKVFTATLLAKKVKKGEMNLKDPISKYLPNTVKAPSRNDKEMTLKDLVTHTSALPRMPNNFAPKNPNNPFADYTYEQLYSFLSNYELTRDIGVQYEYSNLGMGLLGHILELQSGKTYQELMIENIADPLNMNATRLVFTEAMKKRLAVGHSGLSEAENWDIITLAGAGGIRSSTKDMAKFIQANVGVIDSELFEAMQLTHKTTFKKTTSNSEMGWAWHIENGKFLMHNGATGGYRSIAAIEKGTKKGVVVLTNSNESVDAIAIKLMEPTYKLQPIKASISKIIIKEIDDNGITKAISRYKKMKKEQFHEFNFGVGELNTVGYQILGRGDVKTAIAVFNLNVAEFPEASNPYDSLGEAYLVNKDTVLAIKNYKKSLALDAANDNARSVLKRLGETIKELQVPQKTLESYTGKYELSSTFHVMVTTKDGRLFAQATGQPQFELFPSTNNIFYLKAVAAKVEFNRNNKGKLDSLTLFQNGQTINGKKTE